MVTNCRPSWYQIKRRISQPLWWNAFWIQTERGDSRYIYSEISIRLQATWLRFIVVSQSVSQSISSHKPLPITSACTPCPSLLCCSAEHCSSQVSPAVVLLLSLCSCCMYVLTQLKPGYGAVWIIGFVLRTFRLKFFPLQPATRHTVSSVV